MDTASKRFSAIHIALPFRGAGYLPDGSTDRQAAAFLYEGISAVPPAPPVPERVPGGIGKKRKYPKRVYVKGRIYAVASEAEEARILRELAEEAEAQAKILEYAGDRATAEKARKAQIRLKKRAEAAEELRQQWLAFLRMEDEEILLLAA